MRHRFLVSPAWLLRHALVVVLFGTFLVLGWWQVSRAEDGNMRSYGYAAEWPLFAVFLIFFWVRIIKIEIASRERRAEAAASGENEEPESAARERLATAFDPWGRATPQPVQSDPDPELDAYNAYLAGLAERDRAGKPSR